MSVSLTLDSLPNAVNIVKPDFTIVTDTGSYPVHLLLAVAQSPKIASAYMENNEIKEYKLETPDPNMLFKHIADLIHGSTIEIDSVNAFFYNVVAIELQIPQLLHACRKFLPDLGHNTVIEFNPLHPWKGIISYFHPYEDESELQIEVSSSSVYGEPENLILQDNTPTYWESENLRDSYCLFDFVNKGVKLSAYALRSSNNMTDELDPKTWSVEGSHNKDEWFVLDEKYEVNDLVGASLEGFYECQEKASDDAFRYIRITQTSCNEKGTFVFRLARVEFFGEVVSLE